MSVLVDLTNLRGMTDGDADIERELFDDFYTSSEDVISKLKESCKISHANMWRNSAHALRGMSLNLGAERLSLLCQKAEEGHSADEGVKVRILEEIQKEYELVKEFLKTVH